MTDQVIVDSSPSARRRAIAAELRAAASPEVRAALLRRRQELERQTLATAIADVDRALAQSGHDGWTAWMSVVVTAVSEFDLRFLETFCGHAFSFDEGHQAILQRMRISVGLMRQSRWEDAAPCIDELLEQKGLAAPVRARLLAIAGQIEYWRFGRGYRAREKYAAAEELAPADPFVLGSWGDYWLSELNLAKAVQYYKRAINAARDRATGYIGKGKCAQQQQNWKKAERWHRKAIAAAPGDDGGYDQLLQLIGRPETIAHRESEITDLVQAKLDTDPDGAYDTFLQVAQCYQAVQMFDKASEWYGKAIALTPEWPLAFVNLAECKQAEGNAKEAEDLWHRAIALAPHDPRPFVSRASDRERQGKWDDALEILRQQPTPAPFWKKHAEASLGRVLAKQGRTDVAEAHLVSALRDDPSSVHVRRELDDIASGYQDNNDSVAARRLYDTIFEIVGKPYADTYHNAIGNLLYAAGKYAESAEDYQRALDVEPDQAVYHRNLSGALEQTKQYDAADRALRTAFAIDRDRAQFKRRQARIANARGNDAYAAGRYREAIAWYGKAAGLDSTQVVHYTNLALAWQRMNEPGQRVRALEEAMHAYERAQDVAKRQDYTEKIAQLRRRRDFLRAYGEKPLDYIHVVTPIAVEVATDLVPLVQGEADDALSKELLRYVDEMRERLVRDFGVKVPGIRFRGNGGDFLPGTYVIMLDEIPIISANVPTGKLFYFESSHVPMPAEGAITGVQDPITGASGAWLPKTAIAEPQSILPPPIGLLQFMMRHVESLLRRNLAEFVGHQEIASLLDTLPKPLADEMRASSRLVSALTTVCRALAAEEVPINSLGAIAALVSEQVPKDVDLREIVEDVRALPAFRSRLPGIGAESRLSLGPKFEADLRRALYRRPRHLLLALEPERCQALLAAVRDHAPTRSNAVVVEDSLLRPFMRRLVELEWPQLPALSRTELPESSPSLASGPQIEIDGDVPEAPPNFRGVPRAPESSSRPDARHTRPLSEMEIAIFTSDDLAEAPAGADTQSIAELYAMMQDGLFYELGLVLPPPKIGKDTSLKSNAFRFRFNGVDLAPAQGLEHDECLVNDTPSRLRLLGLEGRTASNPASGAASAIIRDTGGSQAAMCTQAGLTTWGPRGYVILQLAAEIRKAAATFQTDAVTERGLDALAEAFPDLVRLTLERFPLPLVAGVLRSLLDEGISVRDLRNICESMLSIEGTTDVDATRLIVYMPYTDGLCLAPAGRDTLLNAQQIAEFVRASFKRYISHKYTRGASTLVVHLLDVKIEERIGSVGVDRLAEDDVTRLRAAVGRSLDSTARSSSAVPVVLTGAGVRRALRDLLKPVFPSLVILSYQELSPDLNIQPVGRISWD